MSTELTTHGALTVANEQSEWTEAQATALGFGPSVTRGDALVYLHVCQRTGLDPFARQIYMLERWSKDGPKQSIQTGIDGYRLIARRAAGRDGYGYAAREWCGQDGVWRDVWLSGEHPAAARVVVTYKGNLYPAVALYAEYVQTLKSGGPNQMWGRMPANQLIKCAEALALRMAFPQDLSGIHTEEEMGQAESSAREARAAAPGTATDRLRAAIAPLPPVDEPIEADVVTGEVLEPKLSDAHRAKMFATLTRKGCPKDGELDFIAQVIGRTPAHRDALTIDEYDAVITRLAGLDDKAPEEQS